MHAHQMLRQLLCSFPRIRLCGALASCCAVSPFDGFPSCNMRASEGTVVPPSLFVPRSALKIKGNPFRYMSACMCDTNRDNKVCARVWVKAF